MGKNTKIYLAISLALFSFGTARIAHADLLNDQHIFTIDSQYDSRGRTQLNATLRGVSTHAYFYVADDYWSGLNNFGKQQLIDMMSSIGNEFDSRIYPTETAFFGSEPNPGIDNDSRLVLVMTALKQGVGGYFDSSNEYSKQDIPTSNEREMIYLNTAQYTESRRLFPFLAHEFQHLISFNQKEKTRNVVDDVWLNEARSEYAITLDGYNTPFIGSTLEQRSFSYLQNPSDSLTEWKNTLADYGQITLFGEYLAEHWSPHVLADTLSTSAISIASINEALTRNGYSDTFETVFQSWMVANFLNDTSKTPLHGYTNPGLVNFRAPATQTMSATSGTISIVANFQNWEQHWYEVPMPPSSLHVVYTVSPGVTIRTPYLIFQSDGSYSLQIADGSDIAIASNAATRIVLMPYLQPKVSSLVVSPESFGLHEGDFIRAEGDNDVYIINEYGFKRLVLSPKICLLYGHLGARGCFSSIHMVTPDVRDAFKTSLYFTNGETNDGIVYRLVVTGEDSAYLAPETHPLDNSVFLINTREQQAY